MVFRSQHFGLVWFRFSAGVRTFMLLICLLGWSRCASVVLSAFRLYALMSTCVVLCVAHGLCLYFAACFHVVMFCVDKLSVRALCLYHILCEHMTLFCLFLHAMCSDVYCLKGIVHFKKKFLPSLTHPQVKFLSSAEHKRR